MPRTYTLCDRWAAAPPIRWTRLTFRPQARSFSPTTTTPRSRSSVNGALHQQRVHDSEGTFRLHPEAFDDVRHMRRPPALQVLQNRRPRPRLRPGPNDDQLRLRKFFDVSFDRSPDEVRARSHPGPLHEPVDFLELYLRQTEGCRRLDRSLALHAIHVLRFRT